MSDRSFVFGVDLDGVVADFYGGLRPIAAEWLGVIIDTLPQRVSWGLTEWGVDEAPGGYERLHRFAVTQRELFSRVPPMPGDIPYWDLCFMQQKTAVGADLYIEDSPANIERLRAEGQKTIVFTNSTNEHLAGPRANAWEEVIQMVLAEKLAWESP